MKRLRSAVLAGALVAIALCFAAPAFALAPAGDGWYWQSPQPQGRGLNGVAMAGSQIWAVGGAGAIVHSSDGGSSWETQAAPAGDPLNAVAFVDSKHGCAVGGWQTDAFTQTGLRSSVILHTVDGGVTWSPAAQSSAWALTDVVFVDDQTAIAVGQHGVILRTVDGGVTWSSCSSGTTEDLGGVAFTDGLHGYALAFGRLVARTVDGGLTWRTAPAREYSWDFVRGLAADGSGSLWTASGMAWDDPGTLLRSGDGGRTWIGVATGSAASFWDVAADGSRICAVGGVISSSVDAVENTGVAVSNDGGATWTNRFLGQGVVCGAVAVDGTGDTCVAGSGRAVSRDDGATWAGVGFDPPGVGSLDFVSATEGWSTGGNAWQRLSAIPYSLGPGGCILHTSDGMTWQEQYSSSRVSFVDVDFADSLSGWAVGTRGAIHHTSDGGKTWTAQARGRGTFYGHVEAPEPRDAWVLGRLRGRGSGGTFLRTTDGGTTWTAVKPPVRLWPMAMRFLTGNEGWIAGWGREHTEVAHTTDGGATWTRVSLRGSPAGLLPLALDFVDEAHGWLVGMRFSDSTSQVLRTEDGGATWSVAADRIDDSLSDLDFVDDLRGWAAGESVWSTDDGGVTWTRRTRATGYGSAVAAADATHVWAAASGYGIISTVDSSGDTAAPTTVSTGDRGWLRRGTSIALRANDGGGSGVALTEFRVNSGAWQPYVAPLDFPAPADHSGDGRHLVEYRSRDAAGLAETIQRFRVDIDTVRPVIRLRPSAVGRDGVLRLHGRIDDTSCPSVEEFELDFRQVRTGRLLTSASFQGYHLPTNRWFTFSEGGIRIYDGEPGTYRVTLRATDRAGNRPAQVGSALLVVKKRPRRRGESVVRSSSLTAADAGAARITVAGGLETPSLAEAFPAWMPGRQREVLVQLVRLAD